MIKMGDISRHIHEHLYSRSKKLCVKEARIGLGYVGCCWRGQAGTLRPAEE